MLRCLLMKGELKFEYNNQNIIIGKSTDGSL